jgi:ribosomal peptide maturation radical SAM protein 1
MNTKAQGPIDVMLISMPFDHLYRPSLQLSLMKANLNRNGITADVRYENLRFAKRISSAMYVLMANEDPLRLSLVGDWIFSGTLFGENVNQDRFVNEILRPNYPEDFVHETLKAKEQVQPFLQDCVNLIIERAPRVIAFATLADQITRHTVSSLALSKLVKQRMPEIFIIIGGPNWDESMAIESIKQFPFLDAVIAGEMDQILPKLVQRITRSKNYFELPGVYLQNVPPPEFKQTPPVHDLNSLPIPDYEDYFQQLKSANLDHYDPPRIIFETSRGCWWGQKNQCTFCGLNGNSIAYRSKTSERALSELLHLNEKYPGVSISAADWILDMKFFKNFLIEISQRNLKLDLFYEVKSNLTKQQLRLLRDAGVRTIQPGIESFSTRILQLISKGCTGLQNIQTLKWCKELGIETSWLMLFGFPNEPSEEYAKITKWIPLLNHLDPPAYCGPFHLDRFSPYHNNPERYGIKNIKPLPAYNFIFPFDEKSLNNLAAFFTYDGEHPESYTTELTLEIQKWYDSSAQSDLFSVLQMDKLLIWDLRSEDKTELTTLFGLEKSLYEFCDSVRTLTELRKQCEELGWALTENEVIEKLQPLIERGLMIRDEDSYLSLALSVEDYLPRPRSMELLLAEFHQL